MSSARTWAEMACCPGLRTENAQLRAQNELLASTLARILAAHPEAASAAQSQEVIG